MGRPYFDDQGVKQPQRMRWHKACAYCGTAFESNRDDAVTCSGRCRTALHRWRREGERTALRVATITRILEGRPEANNA